MRIGVLGSGDVGKTLAAGFLKHGHTVTLASRTPGKLTQWAKPHCEAKIGSFDEAAAFGELIVLAVKGLAAADALRSVAANHLRAKTVVDATNPTDDTPPVNGVFKFFTGPNDSLMEQLQREFADAHFVKAFSSVGAAFMVDPHFKGGKPTMFICGNNDAAKKSVSKILDDFGWEIADMGKAEAARAIEPLAMLWCIPGFLRNDWTHAFKLLTQPVE